MKRCPSSGQNDAIAVTFKGYAANASRGGSSQLLHTQDENETSTTGDRFKPVQIVVAAPRSKIIGIGFSGEALPFKAGYKPIAPRFTMILHGGRNNVEKVRLRRLLRSSA